MFTIYSKPSCPFCDHAKALLKGQDLPYTVINLDVGQTRLEGEAYISRDELLAKIPSARTMPQIFKQSNSAAVHIGGFAELKKHLHIKESYVPA